MRLNSETKTYVVCIANISTTLVKQNNSLAIDTDTVNISTTNATLNNQLDVDNIATRMKSNKRRKNKTYLLENVNNYSKSYGKPYSELDVKPG